MSKHLYALITEKGKDGVLLDLLGRKSIALTGHEAVGLAKAIEDSVRGLNEPSPSYSEVTCVCRAVRAKRHNRNRSAPQSSSRKPKPQK